MNSILIRYGELYLKGDNRCFFERCLMNNVQSVLKDIPHRYVKSSGRCFIEDYAPEMEKTITDRLIKVFGIHSVSAAIGMDTDFAVISENAANAVPATGTFRVTVNRADKRLPKNSTEIAAEVGGYVLSKKPGLKVDLFHAEHEIFIDIRENGKTYVMCHKYYGPGGMPVGSAGKGLLMLSGGIDSPVAAYMMAKRGMNINIVHFHSYPYTSERAKQKVIELANIFSAYTGSMDMHIIALTEIQQEIHMKCPEELMVTLVRRFMLRLANIVAGKTRCGAIITGESLGQVASQTLESLTVINKVSILPVLRPLIGMDKSEIIAYAEKIGTYETSIEPYEDCCTVFLPKNPATRPQIPYVEQAEALLDVNGLIEQALSTHEHIKIKRKI